MRSWIDDRRARLVGQKPEIPGPVDRARRRADAHLGLERAQLRAAERQAAALEDLVRLLKDLTADMRFEAALARLLDVCAGPRKANERAR